MSTFHSYLHEHKNKSDINKNSENFKKESIFIDEFSQQVLNKWITLGLM